MKVLKFGGTSVGSVDSILNLKRIVEAADEPVVVVVSALGGITDKLIHTSHLAVSGDPAYLASYTEMVGRHHEMIGAVIPEGPARTELLTTVDELLGQLKSIYQGVFLIGDLSEKTSCAIVSYGERISSRIVATLIRDARWYDSLSFIKTKRKQGKNLYSNTISGIPPLRPPSTSLPFNISHEKSSIGFLATKKFPARCVSCAKFTA
mgnify:CR=1 FL=1